MGILGPKHKTVRVRANGMDISIDVMLVPLIKKLWKEGIFTSNCCQENRPGIAWIQFQRPRDAIKFLNVVADVPTPRNLKSFEFWDTIYGRMTREGRFGEWEYKCHVRNEMEDSQEADFNFAISIRFPQTDLPMIMRAFSDEKRVKVRLG